MEPNEITQTLRKIKTLVDAMLQSIGDNSESNTIPERDALHAAGKCLHCKRPARGKMVRGLHEACRKSLGDRYSDQELVAAGLMLEAGKGGRPPGPIKIALQDAEKAVNAIQAKSGTSARQNKKP